MQIFRFIVRVSSGTWDLSENAESKITLKYRIPCIREVRNVFIGESEFLADVAYAVIVAYPKTNPVEIYTQTN